MELTVVRRSPVSLEAWIWWLGELSCVYGKDGKLARTIITVYQ
jgi:hypothetical protein